LPFLFANDIVDALVAKHAAAGYRELVFYLEACESGSIFEGLLPDNIDVYATTASNAWESSWGTYCPGMDPNVPAEYDTCLGDLYSVAWMEESEMVDLAKERLLDQYEIVKERTSNRGTFYLGSHVMQYGSIDLNEQPASHYLGRFNFAAEDVESSLSVGKSLDSGISARGAVHQRDADLYHLWHKFQRAEEGSKLKKKALEEITRATTERARIDRAVDLISDLIKAGNAVPLTTIVRPEGAALVDDWDCLKSMVRQFESKCGQLTQYGMKHTRTFADLCNAGISPESLGEVADKACPGMSYGQYAGKFSA